MTEIGFTLVPQFKWSDIKATGCLTDRLVMEKNSRFGRLVPEAYRDISLKKHGARLAVDGLH